MFCFVRDNLDIREESCTAERSASNRSWQERRFSKRINLSVWFGHDTYGGGQNGYSIDSHRIEGSRLRPGSKKYVTVWSKRIQREKLERWTAADVKHSLKVKLVSSTTIILMTENPLKQYSSNTHAVYRNTKIRGTVMKSKSNRKIRG